MIKAYVYLMFLDVQINLHVIIMQTQILMIIAVFMKGHLPIKYNFVNPTRG